MVPVKKCKFGQQIIVFIDPVGGFSSLVSSGMLLGWNISSGIVISREISENVEFGKVPSACREKKGHGLRPFHFPLWFNIVLAPAYLTSKNVYLVYVYFSTSASLVSCGFLIVKFLALFSSD